MKVLLFLVFFPVICFGQQKKDSKIIVTVQDTANLFDRVTLQLYERGYTLEQKDQALGFLSTTEKPLPKATGSIKVKAIMKDSTITFSAVQALDFEVQLFGTKMQRTFEPVHYIGAKNSINMKAWNELQAIAELFTGRIYYGK
jgi:hypothetical protein